MHLSSVVFSYWCPKKVKEQKWHISNIHTVFFRVHHTFSLFLTSLGPCLNNSSMFYELLLLIPYYCLLTANCSLLSRVQTHKNRWRQLKVSILLSSLVFQVPNPFLHAWHVSNGTPRMRRHDYTIQGLLAADIHSGFLAADMIWGFLATGFSSGNCL